MFIPEIHKAINILEKIEPLYNEILVDYLNLSSTQNKLIGYNHAQLRQGINSDGKLIKPFYANIKYKGRKSPVDLYLEGNFYRSFKIEVFKNTDVYLFIFASDSKTRFLTSDSRYGKKVIGLTDKSIDLFAKDFIPYFKREIARKIKNMI